MDTQFQLLVKKLQDTMNQPHGEGINTQQCQVETEIIGYLIGRKVAMHDGEYVPEDLSKYPTLPLPGLNRVATQAWLEFQQQS